MKEIKIFVSSTFYDMQVERDMLKNQVKISLDSMYKDFGISIQFVDLRWGLNLKEEEGKSEVQVLQTCLKEIQDCHPFFISFLGDRYGWVPDKMLREQSCAFMSDADYELVCQKNDISVTEMEILYGAFGEHANLSSCIFCFRDEESYENLPNGQDNIYKDIIYKTKLQKLKEKIIKHCKEKNSGEILNYHLDVSKKYQEQFQSMSGLANQITSILSDKIKPLAKDKDFSETSIEALKVTTFINRHSDNYVKRMDLEDKVINFIQWDNKPFIIMHGNSGIGKSYLLAHIYNEICKLDNYVPLFYSTEFTSGKSCSKDVLLSWSEQLATLMEISVPYGEDPMTVFISLMNQVKEAGKKIVLFLDATENMTDDDTSRNLTFIPEDTTTVISTKNKNTELVFFHNRVKEIKVEGFSHDEAAELMNKILLGAHFHINHKHSEEILSKKTDDEKDAYCSPTWIFLISQLLITLNSYDFYATKDIIVYKEDNYGRFKSFLETIPKNTTTDDYISLLIKFIPPSPDELFMFFVDKAFSYFGKEFTSFFLSLLCMSRFGLTNNDFELLYQDKWNALRFSNLRNFFASIVNSSQKTDKYTFRNDSFKRCLEKQFKKEIQTSRLHYISLLSPKYKEYNDFFEKETYLNVKDNDEGFGEYINQIIETEDFQELSFIISENNYDDITCKLLVNWLKQFSNTIDERYAPIWYRYEESRFSELEFKIIKLLDVKTDAEDSRQQYYWFLAHNMGIYLAMESLSYIAEPLFFFLSIELLKLRENEDKKSLVFQSLSYMSYHNMLVICYGNLSILCERNHQFEDALFYLDKRHEAFLTMAKDIHPNYNILANTARYHYKYGEILENWMGFKKETLNYYMKSVNEFKSVEKLIDQYLHQSTYSQSLRKISKWYELKNDSKNAIKYAVDSCETSFKHLDNCIEESENYTNSEEFLLSALELHRLSQKYKVENQKIKSIIGNALNYVNYVYPNIYCDLTFRRISTEFNKLMLASSSSQDERGTFYELDMKIKEAINAYQNKRKNLSINLLIEAENMAVTLYNHNPNQVIKEKLSNIYYNIGYLYYTKTDAKKYLPLSNTYLKKAANLDNEEAYSLLSQNYRKLGDYDSAIEWLVKGVKKEYSSCYRDYAIYLFEKEKYEMGQKHLEMAITEGDIYAKLSKAIYMFNGEYGYKEDMHNSKELLSSCLHENDNLNDLIRDLLNRASNFANDYFDSGLKHKLYHIISFFEE